LTENSLISRDVLPPPPTGEIEGDSYQQYQTDDNLVPKGVDVDHDHLILHNADQRRADEDAENAPLTKVCG